MPNQALLPTSTAVTPAAAHLSRQPNECYAYFGLRGFSMRPEEVSAMLGLSPTTVGIAGEAIKHSGKKREVSSWSIESRIPRGAPEDFEAHVKDVLQQLEPCFEVAASLSKQYSGVMELVGYFHEFYPGLWFSASTMQRLAALGVGLDCDFYYLVPEEPNQPPQRNAGSRPPSGDSSASETPSSLGPRG